MKRVVICLNFDNKNKIILKKNYGTAFWSISFYEKINVKKIFFFLNCLIRIRNRNKMWGKKITLHNEIVHDDIFILHEAESL